MVHRILATLTAVALSLLLVVPALAGGWAEIVPDKMTAGLTDDPPRAGGTIRVGFFVLQHGQTPADWEVPTVHLTDIATGETIEVVAISDGKDGHFTATTTLPAAGYWSWQVTLRDLLSEHVPAVLAVHTATGAPPPFDPATVMTAIELAKRDVTSSLEARYGTQVERIDGMLANERARTDRLTRELEALKANGATTTGAPGEAPASIPPIAIVTLAVLAGAAAGFVTTWLARRPGPSVTLSPTPREADPA